MCARTFNHRVDTCSRMTNEQLIFHIYGSHCEKKKIYIYLYLWDLGPFNNHSGSILLLSSPFTNINLHVKNPKYDFCSCLGSPGGPFAESKVPKCQRIKTSSQWIHMYNNENNQLFIYGRDVNKNQHFWIFGGPWQCLGEDFNNRIGPISVHIYHKCRPHHNGDICTTRYIINN